MKLLCKGAHTYSVERRVRLVAPAMLQQAILFHQPSTFMVISGFVVDLP